VINKLPETKPRQPTRVRERAPTVKSSRGIHARLNPLGNHSLFLAFLFFPVIVQGYFQSSRRFWDVRLHHAVVPRCRQGLVCSPLEDGSNQSCDHRAERSINLFPNNCRLFFQLELSGRKEGCPIEIQVVLNLSAVQLCSS